MRAEPQLQAQAQKANSTATLFIAACEYSAGAAGRFDAKNEAAQAITRRLKTSFDPDGIFNPGRLFAQTN
jgi:FAD/FMN-containing dehydrogenase